MTGTRQTVLAIGLLNLTSTQETVKKEQDKAHAAGFEVESFAVRPDDESSLEELRGVLKSKQWDMVMIGFGVRGNKDFTGVFEKAVNMCMEEVSPPPKMGFSSAPDDVFDSIRRVLPQQV